MTISARIFALVLIALLPAAAANLVNEMLLYRDREQDVRDTAQAIAETRNAQLDGIVNGVHRVLGAIAQLPASKLFDPPQCAETLGAFAEQYRKDVVLAVADPHGALRCNSLPRHAMASISGRPFFVEAVSGGKLAIGTYTISPISGEKVIPFGYPIRGDDGSIIGVAAAYLSLDWLAGDLQQAPLQPGQSLIITDRDGTILAELPGGVRRIGSKASAAQLAMLRAKVAGTAEASDARGKRVIYGYVPVTLPPPGLYILFGIERDSAFAPLREAAWRSSALIMLSVLGALLIGWMVGVRLIARPVERLLEAAQFWRKGDYQVRADVTSGATELRKLGAAFNDLAETLGVHDRQLSDSNRLKDLILASASHDLRQPLQMLLMAISVLSRRALDPTEKRYVKAADQAIDRLNGELDALINTVRLSGSGREVSQESFAVGPLLDALVEQWADKAGQKCLDLRLRPCNASIVSDRKMLSGIVHNLIGNAIKYTEHGGILIGCRRRGGQLRIEIYDTGVGISEDKIETIFGKFRQLDTVKEGFGLGLWIARSTADALGHTLSVCSLPGRGSRFAIQVPLAPELPRITSSPLDGGNSASEQGAAPGVEKRFSPR